MNSSKGSLYKLPKWYWYLNSKERKKRWTEAWGMAVFIKIIEFDKPWTRAYLELDG